MSDSDSLLTSLKWLLIGGGIVVFVLILLVAYCCLRRDDFDGDGQSPLMDNLLRREHLGATFNEEEDGKDAWQCVVCAYTNSASRSACLMCGTSVGFLMSRKLSRHPSAHTFLTVDDESSTNKKTDDEEIQRTKQRALFKRRMNSMATRKNLTQRQRGAFRRRLWARKLEADGKFHWVRMDSTTPDEVDGDLPQFSSMTSSNAAMSNFLKSGPNGERVNDIHVKSQGFVWQYDDLGRLQWKAADDVSINIDSFEDMSKVFQKDENIERT
jgi:hypothetical protein